MRFLAAFRSTPDDPADVFFNRLAGELASGPLNLPCFPDIVPRVRTALADPDSTADDLVRIAGAEPRLTARLLQTANSAVFSPAGKPVSDLRSAITRLGHHLLQSVTLVFAIQQMKSDRSLHPVAKPLNDLWEKSIAVASICQVLARQLRVPTDKVFLTGLLHGIGHFYVLVRAADPAYGVQYEALPAELIADRHPALGQGVLRKWGFETVMCDAVANQNDYVRNSTRAADITDVLTAGVVLAEALLNRNGDLSEAARVNAFSRLSLDEKALRSILKHTEHHLGSLRDALA